MLFLQHLGWWRPGGGGRRSVFGLKGAGEGQRDGGEAALALLAAASRAARRSKEGGAGRGGEQEWERRLQGRDGWGSRQEC